MQNTFRQATENLPKALREILWAIDPGKTEQIHEVRLRGGRPIQLVANKTIWYLSPMGGLRQLAAGAVCLTQQQLTDCFLALCGYSVHSFQNQLKNGYFTLPGGHRVGVAGQAVCTAQDVIVQLKDITSLNIRIARTKKMQLPENVCRLLRYDFQGVVVAGEPGSGKTTLLREISSLLSDQQRQIAVVDQRRELWPGVLNEAQDLPVCCDVLSGYPRAEGILQALRSLSPDVIICDEVGSVQDAQAIQAGANAGVQMIVSIHARSLNELVRRPQGRLLLNTGAFGTVLFLEGKKEPGRVKEICDCAALCQTGGRPMPAGLRLASGQ